MSLATENLHNPWRRAAPHYPAELITASRPTVNTPRATRPMRGFPSGRLSLSGAVASEGLLLLKGCFCCIPLGGCSFSGAEPLYPLKDFLGEGLPLAFQSAQNANLHSKMCKMQLCAPKSQKYNSALQNLRNIALHFKISEIYPCARKSQKYNSAFQNLRNITLHSKIPEI